MGTPIHEEMVIRLKMRNLEPGSVADIKIASYKYWIFHYKINTASRRSYLYKGNPFAVCGVQSTGCAGVRPWCLSNIDVLYGLNGGYITPLC